MVARTAQQRSIHALRLRKARVRMTRAIGILAGVLMLGMWALAQSPTAQAPSPQSPPRAQFPQDAPLPALTKSFLAAGEAKPILLSADAIATWPDAGQRVFLLKGKVKIEQGLNVLSFNEGTVWVDENRKKTNGIYYLRVYGEGALTVSEGAKKQNAAKGWIEMGTRGEIRIKAYGSKVIQQALPREPMYQKALSERALLLSPRPVTTPSGTPTPGTTTSASAPPPGTFIPPPGMPQMGLPATGSLNPAAYIQPAPPAVAPPPVAPPVAPPNYYPNPPTPNAPGTPPAYRPGTPLPLNPMPGTAPLPGAPQMLPPPLPLGPNGSIQQTSFQVAEASPPSGGQPSGGPVVQAVPAQGGGGVPVPGLPTQGPGQFETPGGVAPPGTGPVPPPPRNNNTPATAPEGVAGQPPPPLPPAGGTKGPPRQLTIRPRSSEGIKFRNFPMENGESAVVIPNGAILQISSPTEKVGLIDIEADRLVFWTRGESGQLLNAFNSPQGYTTNNNTAVEFFLSGNVEIRSQTKKETQILRADEVYYDVSRNVAVAVRGDLEVRQPRLPNPIHMKGEELLQLNPKLYAANDAQVFSTVLPSDPGLRVVVKEATLEDRDIIRKTIFGNPIIDRNTGREVADTQRFFTGKNAFLYLENVPIFWLPYVQGDAEDPLGPLESLSFGYSKIFGAQFFTSWNVYDLIGVTPAPGTRWRLHIDGMTARGPALGTDYDAAGKDLFGIPNRYEALVKAYGIWDNGLDILGGNLGQQIFVTPTKSVPITHPEGRGRFFFRGQLQDLPDGFTVQSQISILSDHNFMAQYYKYDFDNELDQDTYVYVKQQQQNRAWTFLAGGTINNWMTATEWLPKADGYLLGQKVLGLATWNVHASAGYGELYPAHQPPPVYQVTDARVNSGRFDVWSDLSLPFMLGDVNIAPYIVGDATYYTEDVVGDGRGRLYGGGGVRASVPFSHLYPGVWSELFNLDGLYHKIVLSGNYFIAHSDTAFTMLPQLDQLNDQTTDIALRDIRPRQPTFNPGNALLLASPLFNPQVYAIQRLIDNRVDTLDSIDIFQLGLRQRLQTKRGLPGHEHVIDWMVLDLRASIFPQANRDNFGTTIGLLEYDWVWNIGDRTSLVSTGWMDPIDPGPRFFTVGANINRPDRTNFYLGYRHYDPLESRAIVASLTYAFSAKYAITASTMYDLGIAHNNVNSLTFTRIGTDIQISLGFNYNAILNTFGFTFEVLPNLLPSRGHVPMGVMSPFAHR